GMITTEGIVVIGERVERLVFAGAYVFGQPVDSGTGSIRFHRPVGEHAVIQAVASGRGAVLVEPVGEVDRNGQCAVRLQHQPGGGREVIMMVYGGMFTVDQHNLTAITHFVGVDQAVGIVDSRPVRIEEWEVGQCVIGSIVDNVVDAVLVIVFRVEQ